MPELPQEAVDVFTRLNELVHASSDPQEVYDAIVRATVHLVDGCDRAAIMLRERGRFTSAAVTDEVARHVDDMELEIGDGPCVDAILEDAIQHDPDLTTPNAWPALAAQVVAETPVRGMIGCRLRVEGEKVGALDLFSDTPGALDAASVDQAAIMASLASSAIMAVRARHQAGHLERALDNSREIGKAIGLIMAARRITDQEAFELLRTSSQELNMKLATVAHEIVAGHERQRG